jgi:hypothetical protein
MNSIKKYSAIVLIQSIILLIVSSLLISCSDENEEGSEVQLLSFGPTGARHGETIKFIGHNLNQVTSIEFVGVTVDKSTFTNQTPELIELLIPQGAEEGSVILKTTSGDIISKTVLSFNVVVTISSLPAEVKPGTSMTITGEFVNWIKEVWFTDGIVVDEFISKSVNELVLQVPMNAQTGPLVFVAGGTKPEEIDSEENLAVTLPGITSISPTTIEHGENLTITGTDLDLVSGILFKGSDNAVTDFVSQTKNEIVVTIPNFVNKGKISAVAFSGVKVESSDVLVIPLPPLDPLGLAIFDDALENGWQKWGGWGAGSSDASNTDNVREGSVGIKVVLGGDWGGALQFGNGNFSTTGFTEFAVSIFGTPGTGGKVVNLIVKGGTIEEKQITIVEGEWTEYKLSLSSVFGSPSTITEIVFQDRGWSGTLYVDHIGLR